MDRTNDAHAANWALARIADLRLHHYVLRGRNADGRGWVTFAPRQVEEYRRRTNDHFCLVLIVSDCARWYAMPWTAVSRYFTDATLYQLKDGRRGWTLFEAELGGEGGDLQMSDGRRDGGHVRIPAQEWAQNRSVLDLEQVAREAGGERPSPALPFDPADVVEDESRVQRQIRARRGQAQFRAALLRAYGGACAISGCAVVDVLEAAHIVPHRGRQSNHVQNGLLLRADLHTLFDLHRVVVDVGNMTVVLDPELRRDAAYAGFHGRRIRLPQESHSCPSAIALAHHRARSRFT